MAKQIFSMDFYGKKIQVEVGEMAKQANGSCLVRYDDTVVLSTACAWKEPKYVDLLRQRCEVFKKEADECGLTYYPYKEGFFVTLKVEDDDLLTRFHEAMLAQDIYTIKVNKGIRVALCSLSIEKCQGLAFKMKEILDSLK